MPDASVYVIGTAFSPIPFDTFGRKFVADLQFRCRVPIPKFTFLALCGLMISCPQTHTQRQTDFHLTGLVQNSCRKRVEGIERISIIR